MDTDEDKKYGIWVTGCFEIALVFCGARFAAEPELFGLAAVERAEIFPDEMDWMTYERRGKRRYRVTFLEWVKLLPKPATGQCGNR